MIIFFVMAETFVYTTDFNDIRLSWQNFYRGINLLLLRTTYLLFVFQKMSETIYGNFARGESWCNRLVKYQYMQHRRVCVCVCACAWILCLAEARKLFIGRVNRHYLDVVAALNCQHVNNVLVLNHLFVIYITSILVYVQQWNAAWFISSAETPKLQKAVLLCCFISLQLMHYLMQSLLFHFKFTALFMFSIHRVQMALPLDVTAESVPPDRRFIRRTCNA